MGWTRASSPSSLNNLSLYTTLNPQSHVITWFACCPCVVLQWQLDTYEYTHVDCLNLILYRDQTRSPFSSFTLDDDVHLRTTNCSTADALNIISLCFSTSLEWKVATRANKCSYMRRVIIMLTMLCFSCLHFVTKTMKTRQHQRDMMVEQ